MKPAPRVVLDTNVVLSALLFAQGRLARLRADWQQEGFHPLASTATIGELMRALTYPKFKLTVDEQHELLADYLPWCTTVSMPKKPPRTPICRDPFDAPFLQLAIVGKAAFLVTGDDDLLGLASRFCCPIVTAQAFVSLLATP
ncbi:MAG: putative toxin-antitoxin system toxin component, PIN family [Casimicrobiaceae bacterium]